MPEHSTRNPETLGSADELIEDEMEKSSKKLLFSKVPVPSED